MNIYELYGRLTEQHSVECIEHRKTLKLLGEIKRGAIDIKNIEVQEDGWKIVAPKEPATPLKITPDQEQESA